MLAGDHCQLPATVVSAEARAGGLDISLLEALMISQERGGGVGGMSYSLLDTQYRQVLTALTLTPRSETETCGVTQSIR